MLEAHAALVSALRGLNFDNTALRELQVLPPDAARLLPVRLYPTSAQSSWRHMSWVLLRGGQVDSVVGGPIRTVRGAHMVRVQPTPLKNPVLVAVSQPASELLDLPAEGMDDPHSDASVCRAASRASCRRPS